MIKHIHILLDLRQYFFAGFFLPFEPKRIDLSDVRDCLVDLVHLIIALSQLLAHMLQLFASQFPFHLFL